MLKKEIKDVEKQTLKIENEYAHGNMVLNFSVSWKY